MWKKYKPYIIFVAISVGVGALAGMLTKNGVKDFESIVKPPLTPPSWVFPVVWTILFVLMGIGAAMVYLYAGEGERSLPLFIYGTQLAVNFFWSIIFFNAQDYLFAFLWLILLWLMIIAMIVSFGKVNRTAALLQVPYLLWVTFAGYLNYMIWRLN